MPRAKTKSVGATANSSQTAPKNASAKAKQNNNQNWTVSTYGKNGKIKSTRPMRVSDLPVEEAEGLAANIYDKFKDCLVYAAQIQALHPDYQPPWAGVNPNHQIPWTAEGKSLVKTINPKKCAHTPRGCYELTRAVNARGSLAYNEGD